MAASACPSWCASDHDHDHDEPGCHDSLPVDVRGALIVNADGDLLEPTEFIVMADCRDGVVEGPLLIGAAEAVLSLAARVRAG